MSDADHFGHQGIVVGLLGVVLASVGTDIIGQTEIAVIALALMLAGVSEIVYANLLRSGIVGDSSGQNARSMAEPTEVSVDE